MKKIATCFLLIASISVFVSFKLNAGTAPDFKSSDLIAQDGKNLSDTHIKFEVRFSELVAVFSFMQGLSKKSAKNSFKTIFENSTFNTQAYKDKISAFDSITISYHYEFPQYPPNQKIGASCEDLIRMNLINCNTLDDFRRRSLGLIPFSDLSKLVQLIQEFTPLYKELIYEPNQATFEKQLKDIEERLIAKNIAGYFEQAKVFYRSAWDNSVPFIFTFYPLPGSTGFRATAFSNVVLSPLPTSWTDYDLTLALQIHEMAHILCDEQSVSTKLELEEWFTSNPSTYSHYARGLVQEAWATAIGNGYFSEKLSGKLNTGSWYGVKYINLMAKQVYPFIKGYLDSGKPFDKALVDQHIKILADSFPTWINDLHFLLTDRSVISQSPSDFDMIDKKFRYCSTAEYYEDFSESSFQKLKEKNLTKVIVVSKDNKNKLELIRANFNELKSWHPDAKKDFTYSKMMADRTILIVVNLVNASLEQQLGLQIELDR